jgi:hypothetical protein
VFVMRRVWEGDVGLGLWYARRMVRDGMDLTLDHHQLQVCSW